MGDESIFQDALYRAIRQIAPGMSPEDITYVNSGQDKHVFVIPRVKIEMPLMHADATDILATAIPKDTGYPLYKEFQLLQELEKKMGAGVYTPRPEFFHHQGGIQLLGMEFVKEPLARDVVDRVDNARLENIAFEVGRTVGAIYRKTGLFHVEPHNENLMIGDDDHVRFIDAIHFEKGSERELLDTFMRHYSHERREIDEYPRTFLEGLNYRS